MNEFSEAIIRYMEAEQAFRLASSNLRELVYKRTTDKIAAERQKSWHVRRTWSQSAQLAQQIRAAREADPTRTNQSIAEEFKVSRYTVHYYLSPKCKAAFRTP